MGVFKTDERDLMAEPPFQFSDGAAYERMMGAWSGIVGDVFLDWLAPAQGLRWIDVGCGNGAFTERLIERTSPSAVDGIDPSEGQLAYARTRAGAVLAKFHKGGAMALPFADRSFDAAVMALVIFFVPDPAKGVAEMARVVTPGGIVAAYAWDVAGGGFPLQPVQTALLAMGHQTLRPPSADASKMDVMQKLWADAGLVDVETQTITVQRAFVDFDDFWGAAKLGTSIAATLDTMSAEDVERLRTAVRAGMTQDAAGRITCSATANAIKGRMPG
jgi:SAM-dependent methyltransferase